MKYIDYSVAEAADLMTVLGFETETAKPVAVKSQCDLSGTVEKITNGGNKDGDMQLQSNDGQQTVV